MEFFKSLINGIGLGILLALAIFSMLLFFATLSPLFAETHFVEIVNFKFKPKVTYINKGDTVIWTNKSTSRHNIVHNPVKGMPIVFISSFLKKGESFRYTFRELNDYSYYCTPHKNMDMVGSIIVNEKRRR